MSIAWSYSSLSEFETCPRRYYLLRVTKEVKDKTTFERGFGNEVHKAFENYVKDGEAMPSTMSNYVPLAEKVRSIEGTKLAERRVALNENLEETSYFAKDVWLRAIVDLTVLRPDRALVLDYKTGKRKDNFDQLKLFAAVTMSLHKFAEKVVAGFVWLKDGTITKEVYTREQQEPIWDDFRGRVERIEDSLKADSFPPKPSGLCRAYCPVGSSKCEFCGTK